MAKSKDYYGHGVTHPGLSYVQHPEDMRFPSGSPSAFLAANHPARAWNSVPFQGIGMGMTYSTLDWTTSIPNTADAIAIDTSGGVLLTCGSDGTFSTNMQSINLWAPGVGKRLVGGAILQTSDITTVGFTYSFGTSAIDPVGTNYTDCIKLNMAVGAGVILGSVRGGSGTASATGTLYTAVAATDLFVGFDANFGILKPEGQTTVTTGASSATQTLGSTAGIQAGDVLYFATTAVYAAVASVTNSTVLVLGTSISTTTAEVVTVYGTSGGFWAGATPQSATYTPFTSAQLVQLAKIVRASPSMYHNINAKGSAGTPTVLVKTAYMERDR